MKKSEYSFLIGNRYKHYVGDSGLSKISTVTNVDFNTGQPALVLDDINRVDAEIFLKTAELIRENHDEVVTDSDGIVVNNKIDDTPIEIKKQKIETNENRKPSIAGIGFLFSKFKNTPTKITVEFEINVPSPQILSMILNEMEESAKSEVVDYYASQVLMNEIKKKIKQQIKQYISNHTLKIEEN